MKRVSNSVVIFLVFIGMIIIIPVSYILMTISYERNFKEIKRGQSKSEVISTMGKAFSGRKCSVEIRDFDNQYLGKCFEIYRYSIPWQQWEIAFDEDGKAIEKYNVFLGEYGDRAPQ